MGLGMSESRGLLDDMDRRVLATLRPPRPGRAVLHFTAAALLASGALALAFLSEENAGVPADLAGAAGPAGDVVKEAYARGRTAGQVFAWGSSFLLSVGFALLTTGAWHLHKGPIGYRDRLLLKLVGVLRDQEARPAGGSDSLRRWASEPRLRGSRLPHGRGSWGVHVSYTSGCRPSRPSPSRSPGGSGGNSNNSCGRAGGGCGGHWRGASC